ncbi:MAG: SRPBCC domain-containing protein [Bacteroidota bacterium]
MKKIEPPIIVTQSFSVSKEALWLAITERDQMVQWFFENIPAFEPIVGFKTQFVVENEGRIFPHQWKIMEVHAHRRIAYNWKYEGYEGDSIVTFELAPIPAGTQLALTHKVLDSFSADVPEFSRASCEGGWNYFIKERLHAFIKAKASDDSSQEYL